MWRTRLMASRRSLPFASLARAQGGAQRAPWTVAVGQLPDGRRAHFLGCLVWLKWCLDAGFSRLWRGSGACVHAHIHRRRGLSHDGHPGLHIGARH